MTPFCNTMGAKTEDTPSSDYLIEINPGKSAMVLAMAHLPRLAHVYQVEL